MIHSKNNNVKLPKRINRETLYESKWVNLYKDEVIFPDGRLIKEHHMLEYDYEAVAVIVENEKDEILFIESYRYTTQSVSLEIPAGGVDSKETIIEAGIREVLEETGYEIGDCESIYRYYPNNGISNQVFNIIKAKAIKKSMSFDKNEVKNVMWLGKATIKDKIIAKEILDGFSLTALLIHLQFDLT